MPSEMRSAYLAATSGMSARAAAARIAEESGDADLIERQRAWRQVHDATANDTDEDAPGH